MIRLLSSNDAESYQKFRLLSLKTDPKAFLATYEQESTFPLSYYQTKITYATKPPIFGIYGYFIKNTSEAKPEKQSSSAMAPDNFPQLEKLNNKPKLIGTIQLSAEYHPKNQHLANIYNLYVHPDHRGKSIASKLLEHVIQKARTNPVLEQLHLRANSDNQPAIALYQKFGFSHIASRKQAVKEPNGTYQDELFFCLRLF